jgi:hypothetical protein
MPPAPSKRSRRQPRSRVLSAARLMLMSSLSWSPRAIERASRHGLDFDSSLDLAFEQGRDTPELETLIYRIIQEALTNATKHGHPTGAVTETRENASTIELSVRDDGEGSDPESRTAGFGSLGMRERAQLLHRTIPGQRHHHRCERPVQRRPPGQTRGPRLASPTRAGGGVTIGQERLTICRHAPTGARSSDT